MPPNSTNRVMPANESTKASGLKSSLPAELQRILSYATETGASSWLTVLPMQEHGFALHKGAFRDAICLRYGWHLSGLPPICACSKDFTVEHAMNCPTGGFPTIRHNELRDFTASLLSEVCHGVSVEPHLQPLTGEIFHLLQLLLRMVQDWMLLRMVFGEVTIRRSSLMLRCLILMLHLAEVPVCLHYIVDWKRRSGGSMSSEFVMWRWDVLLLWYF